MTTTELVVHGVGQEDGTVPLADVSSILFRDRGRGAVEGALVGLGVSAALGVTAIVDDDYSLFGSRSDAFIVVTAISAILTVPVGAVLGALIGHRTTIAVRPAR